ncbi:glycosyltransferase family 2 protein [Mucilaginibacter ginkgonis]|uniref:Glycosyltransferase n=1 Tax=Mucilaginibacter ginkgonis TaxID=2682091 RepID=A0A6I4HUH1_9SPHI|nr:glycosyltransferase [Mucilaginibacter ginkgonis]QQL50206.1 glycosyltransferase [Mucilaginibacter ginkgonis]
MKASFVIVNYNRKDELLFTLKSTKELIRNTDYEIVVVDNASTDGSADAVREAYPDVVLLINSVNTGAPAWNLGFKAAKGDYFVILDDDSHIEYGLEEALNYMDANKDVGVLALNVVTGPYTSEMWDWKDGQDTVGFIGCGAILRKDTYYKIGGYADWIFLYVNEWEYGLRCIDAGYSVKFFEDSKVIHRASSINRSSKRLRIFVTQHELGIVYKFFSVKRNKYLLRVMINNLKIIKHGDFKNAWYNLIGISKFFSLAKKLSYTPVSPEAQQLFVENFQITKKSAFGFLLGK